MSLDNSSRSRSRSRSRSPMDRKIRTQHYSNRVAPYRRESRRGFSENSLCNNCRRPGHFARECPNAALCHNCGLPGYSRSFRKIRCGLVVKYIRLLLGRPNVKSQRRKKFLHISFSKNEDTKFGY